ncbi:LysE family translocator [Advenella mimigardefordensis]|uniref:Putative homoserine/homoserine lactone efflux protein n=1 Tax=Advenella mimigardefordensis (strain DSM 17166 / LMG 22922 / DPN7) TaxID=1247726 RepID=W0PGY3_ADVMD|nr:LysE family translocator [Advenella mimigardefordensis]AHG65102.1 putative homoserine/homoserine lactone efflux protein [Advenella mimigardefordensis DPN7]
MSLEFLLTSLIVVISPGTGAIITIAAGLSRGYRAAIVSAFGCTLGVLPHMFAAITGLAALLHTSALAFEIVRYAGVAYLLYMALTTLREHGALKIETGTPPRSNMDVIRSAITVNLLNPKLSIFFFAFLPQFVGNPAGSPLPIMLELSAVFMAMTFVVFTAYGVFAANVRRHVISRPSVMNWLRRSFAAAFVALSAKLALTDR